jgi:hypothetical protein
MFVVPFFLSWSYYTVLPYIIRSSDIVSFRCLTLFCCVFRSNAQLIESDLFGTIEVLAQIANTRNPPEGLVQLVDMIKVGRFLNGIFYVPYLLVSSCVVDPHHFHTFWLVICKLTRIRIRFRIQLITEMLIRIRIFI